MNKHDESLKKIHKEIEILMENEIDHDNKIPVKIVDNLAELFFNLSEYFGKNWTDRENNKNFNFSFNPGIIYTADGYSLCSECKSKTIRVMKDISWYIDAYPYKDQEETTEDIPDIIETNIEISGHYCLKCDKMRSICICDE